MQDCWYNTTSRRYTPINELTVITVTKIQTSIRTQELTSYSLLVMIINYPSCGLPASITENTVRGLFLGPRPDGTSLAQKFEQCSYGRTTFNVTAFRVLNITQMCNTSISASCAPWTISSSADIVAQAILGIAVFNTYTHYVYILPPGMQRTCPWAGLALVPGQHTWLQTIQNGEYRWATVMQEILHNAGE